LLRRRSHGPDPLLRVHDHDLGLGSSPAVWAQPLHGGLTRTPITAIARQAVPFVAMVSSW
jgi:hypothetical protein